METQPGSHESAVTLDQLSPLERIVARTRHHVYEIVSGATDDGTILVRGGNAFPEFVSARLIGSSSNGRIRFGTIAVGSRIHVEASNGRWLMTTPVEALAVTPRGIM
jgi:hypothetical protein